MKTSLLYGGFCISTRDDTSSYNYRSDIEMKVHLVIREIAVITRPTVGLSNELILTPSW